MNIKENIILAFESLRSNKMRALLTMLGIIIGISSVIAIMTIGKAVKSTVTNSMGDVGAANISLRITSREDMDNIYVYKAPQEKDLITDEMLKSFENTYSNDITSINLTESVANGTATNKDRQENVSVSGINNGAKNEKNLTFFAGRNLSDTDEEKFRQVCIIPQELAKKLYRTEADAINKELVVKTNNDIFVFTIVGVYKESSNGFYFGDLSVYIPFETAKNITKNTHGYSAATIVAKSADNSKALAEEIKKYFEKYYARNKDFKVEVQSMQSMLDQMNKMMNNVNLAISAIAAISLLVGGIGVMNIMLVSVTERTREIGVRKALGATRNNIRAQFVTESIIVCTTGGTIGIILGGLLGYFGSSLMQLPTLPSISSIVLAVGFSMAIGIFFGYYPADKAAKLDPLDALRYE